MKIKAVGHKETPMTAIASPTAATFYITGGTLPPDALSYVERQADRDLLAALRQGEYCYLLNSRQMGKSSLCVRAIARLREEGTRTVFLDLTKFGGRNLTAEQWYAALLAEIGRELGLRAQCLNYWKEHPELPPVQRLFGAITEVVLPSLGIGSRAWGIGNDPMLGTPHDPTPTPNTPYPTPRLVVFVDEIDVTRSLPFSTDEFFAAIRQCYVGRATEPALKQVAFCLLGTATPAELIEDTRISPFNIGRRIEVQDFTPEEAAPLAAGLLNHGDTETQRNAEGEPGSENGKRPALLRRILHWTGGHPYLTQRLCRAVAEQVAASTPGTRRPTPADVDRLCEALFLTHTAKEGDDNLALVRNRLLKSEVELASLLELYGKLRAGQAVRDDETNPLCGVLKLSGVAKVEGGRLAVRNRIYGAVFDRGWVAQHMPDAELRRQREAYRRGLLRAATVSVAVLAVMSGLALTAVQQAHRASQQRRLAREKQRLAEAGQQTLRHLLYVADMNVAQQDWETSNGGRMMELLEAHRPQRGEEDLRGFEWFYLWRLGHGDRLTLPGRPPLFGPVAFSPDGKVLAVAGTPSGVHLWDTSTGRKLRTLTDHNMWLEGGLRFSSDGKMLTTVIKDGTVRLWDLKAARAPRAVTFKVVTDPKISPLPPALSPVANVLAVHDTRDRMALRDLTTGRVLRTFPTGPVSTYAFSPDGKTLAAGRSEEPILLWDVKTGRKTGVFQDPGTNVQSLALSPDGRRLAAGNFDGVLKIWDVPAGKELFKRQAHRVVIGGLAFSPNGRLLATASRDSTAKLWDVESGQEIQTFRGHGGELFSVAFSPDGRRLATACFDGTAKVWDVVGAPQGSTPPWERERAGSLAFAPDGRTLATSNRQVQLWRVPAGHGTPTLQGHVEGHDPLAFSPDGKLLATVSRRTVRLWDLATGRETRTLAGRTGDLVAVAFSPAGRTLATASQDTTVRLWNVATGRQIWTRSKFLDVIHSAAFSPDGRTLAVAGFIRPHQGGFTQLLAADTGRLVRTLKGHTVTVCSVAYSPDGRLLAAASWDSTATLWDPATGQLLRTLPNPILLTSVAFSPDGRRLATGDGDGIVKLWDPASGREILTLRGLAGDTRVVFSPDGRRLAACDLKRKVMLWEAAGKEEVAAREAREHATAPSAAR